LKSWTSKIIGHEEVAPDQLLSHPENWRIHPKFQQEALRGAIEDIGFIRSVTVNKRTGRVIDGHLRVTLALRDNIPLIPVEYIDLSEQEETEALLTLDPLAALAVADKKNLESLLQQINTDNENVTKLLDQLSAQSGLIDGVDFEAEWRGMPEFERAPDRDYRAVHVHFTSQADVDEFSKRIGQSVGPKTTSLWFPPQEKQDLKSKAFVGES